MPPGMLFVTMQPQPGLSLDQFHEWYNNEHGPTRLRIPSIFANGLRYEATDGQEPTFLAAYDVADLDDLTTPLYTDLRANRSPREAATIGQVDVVRHLWALQSAKQRPDFVAPEALPGDAALGRVLVWVEVSLRADVTSEAEAETETVRWYEEEHIPMLAKVPGWLRTRRYRSTEGPLRLVTLHEYERTNGQGGPEHAASMATPWREKVFSTYIGEKRRRAYSLFYVFGPAPRDLAPLKRLAEAQAFSSASGDTATTTGPDGTIRSFVTARDGLVIPYVLEGSGDASAPTVAFANSLLTSLHMWDDVVALVRRHRPGYRILRYDQRGRGALPSPPQPATMAALADDLRDVLAALRIPRLHALVGVSQGGATALQFSVRHPALASRVVACDCNIASAPGNTQAWKDRIVAASAPEAAGREAFAVQNVTRWFHPETVRKQPATTRRMVAMVRANSLEGFAYGSQALWDYDLRAAAAASTVPTLLVVGETDSKGVLVAAMQGFKGGIGPDGAELRIVPTTGHLPMCEAPAAFWETIEDFV